MQSSPTHSYSSPFAFADHRAPAAFVRSCSMSIVPSLMLGTNVSEIDSWALEVTWAPRYGAWAH